jgi:hypothetical protein
MDYSNNTALFQPLVGTEQQQPKLVVPTADETPLEEDVPQEPPSQHNHDIWISVLLFALMYIHFGLIYYSDPNHIINGVSWTTINLSISLFIVATFLYRHALHDCQIQNDFMMLLPEILILISMAFVFFQYIITAFLLLAVGKLYMAFTVIIINSYKLWSLSSTNEDQFEVQQHQESKDSDSIV